MRRVRHDPRTLDRAARPAPARCTQRLSTTSDARYAGCQPATWLAERLAVDPAMIDAMRRDGELIAVREPGSTEWLYPPWQFDGRKPRPEHPADRRARRARRGSTRRGCTRS